MQRVNINITHITRLAEIDKYELLVPKIGIFRKSSYLCSVKGGTK